MKKTVGEALLLLLANRGVDTIFGIPGVHTVEMYRGLPGSGIRHITPRHEQSAGFMADGYARATGKPGVCLLITGPGVTNAITPMAQARADSIPMLVISGVNRVVSFGKEEGLLHELPDQQALMAQVAILSQTLLHGRDLERVVDRAFAAMSSARPGPVHIEVPLDVMRQRIEVPALRETLPPVNVPDPTAITEAATLIAHAQRPVIVAGGGAIGAADAIRTIAERLDAPVVTTINARGIAGRHPLRVPASPSLPAVRGLLADADLTLAIGTQFGRTDYDMYDDDAFPPLSNLIRIDCDARQAERGHMPDLAIIADARAAVQALLEATETTTRKAVGASRAAATRAAALQDLDETYRCHIALIDQITDTIPGVRIVGDSTQVVYAGNMFTDISAPRRWFNAATGYGALGYGAAAAIGAAIGDPATPVVCITGDGGLQFCLAELGTAMDEGARVIFVVWNNNGYQEIERYMLGNAIPPVGVKPSAPDFVQIATAYGIEAEMIVGTGDFVEALARARDAKVARLIEIRTP